MSGSVQSAIELYDSDFFKLEGVVAALQEKQGTMVDLEGFRKEIIERFAEQGFRVDVRVWETDQPGLYAFDATIVDRMEPHTFDKDRQVHEVTRDILGLGTGGVIKTDKK